MSEHSEQVLELHKQMIRLGAGLPVKDVIAALALTVAYATKYCIEKNFTAEYAVEYFGELVLVEYYDPNSQMAKPENIT